MDISKRIIKIREAKKISPSDIADKIGIERPNYYRLEKRGEKLTIEQLKQIASALDVELSELLDIQILKNDNEKVIALEKRVLELEDRIADKIQSNTKLTNTIGEINSMIELYIETKARQLKLGSFEYLDSNFNVTKTITVNQLYEETGELYIKDSNHRYILSKQDKIMLIKYLTDKDWIIDLQRILFYNGYLRNEDFVEAHKRFFNWIKDNKNENSAYIDNLQ